MGMEGDCMLQERGRSRRLLAIVETIGLQIEVIGCRHSGGAGRPGKTRPRDQPQLERRCDFGKNSVLKREDVLPGAVETLCPKMAAVVSIDQLSVDADV